MKENVAFQDDTSPIQPHSDGETYAGSEQRSNCQASRRCARPGRPDPAGARRIIQQAVKTELAATLEQSSNVKTIDGRRAVVRMAICRSARSSRPSVLCRSKCRRCATARARASGSTRRSYHPTYDGRRECRCLYLRCVSTSDMSDALSELGEEHKRLSASIVGRLKGARATCLGIGSS